MTKTTTTSTAPIVQPTVEEALTGTEQAPADTTEALPEPTVGDMIERLRHDQNWSLLADILDRLAA